MKRFLAVILLVSLAVATSPRTLAQQTTSDEAQPVNPGIWVLVGGAVAGGLYLLLHPHPRTTSRPPTPAPSVPPTPPPTPSPTPQSVTMSSPTATPKCQYFTSDGWFEPMQTVYQDDPDFPDKPGKQLTRLDFAGLNYPLYQEELRMIRGRPAVITGVDHYQYHGQKVMIPLDLRRRYVVIKVKTNCTEEVDVKLRIRGDSSITPDPVYETPPLDRIPLAGPPSGLPPAQWPEYTVKYNVGPLGWPYPEPIEFKEIGHYFFTAELLDRDGKPFTPNLHVDVIGNADFTYGFNTLFIPVAFTTLSAAGRQAALDDANRLATDVRLNLPDVYPLRKGQITTRVMSPVELDMKPMLELPNADSVGAALQANFESQLSLDAFNLHEQRVIAILSGTSLSLLLGHPVAGRTFSAKLIVVERGASYWTAGHEIAHSINYLWTSPQMIQECSLDYHNDAGVTPQWKFAPGRVMPGYHLSVQGPANGIRVTERGENDRSAYDARPPMMGSAGGGEYMTQCTYKHLYDGLRVFLWDPPATLVRGFVRRYLSGTYAARFQPFYNGESEGLPKSGTGGQLAFVVRDGNGSVLARYPFTPVFETGDGPARSFMAFAQPIPALSAAARSIELVAPNGVIARKALVGPAPQVTIETPQAQPAGAVRFSWTSDPGTVFTAYLSGGGALRRLFSESTQHAVTVSLAPRARYTFELIASNGSRSTQVSRTVAGGGT